MVGLSAYVLSFIDPDEIRKCALCRQTSDESAKKIILSPAVESRTKYYKMGDYDLVQIHHRLPKIRNKNGTVSERGDCK